ncbi:hypothetical protein [Rhodovulum sulfidophilum]|uniref:hypothetical protein n=1 Tax=Rhodovulum sulfidophilum TaxID=35806 RepID=UPI001179EF95|nr:hypothetical protein [Rhodovulum sulfidophilum]MBL3551084.1 hypothetical protein [Rhodovulum sulfidophilum]
MKHEWLIDILGDLKNYARKNGLTELSEELLTCQALAAVEISSLEAGRARGAVGEKASSMTAWGDADSCDARRLRIVPGPFATGNDA